MMATIRLYGDHDGREIPIETVFSSGIHYERDVKPNSELHREVAAMVRRFWKQLEGEYQKRQDE